MPSRRGFSRGAGRSVVWLVSLTVHAAAIVWMLQSLTLKAPVEPPVMQVTMVPPPRTAREPMTPPPPVKAPDRESPAPPSRAPVPSAPPTDVAPRYVEAEPLPGPLRPVVPGLRGCESLSRAARERCQTERWAKVDELSPKLNFDAESRFAANPEPFLSRRPKKGCRLRVAGDVDPKGDSGNAIGGVTCVIPF